MAKAKTKARAKAKTADDGVASRAGNMLYSANQIWLAGLGALGRAQGGAGGLQRFEGLMKEGTRLQTAALDTAQKAVMQAFRGAQQAVDQKVGGVRNQAQGTWDNLEKIFQTRVQRALHQLGMPTAEEMSALAQRVGKLNQNVEALARTSKPKAAKGTRKPARKPARKPRAATPPGTGEG